MPATVFTSVFAMKNRILIVDGHNVIFKSPELRMYADLAVDRLINILNSSAFSEFEEIYAVFDSSESFRKVYRTGNVTVIMCSAGEEADSVIVKILDELPSDFSAYVVSDDFSVQMSALNKKQLRMTTREFFSIVSGKRKGLPGKTGTKRRPAEMFSSEERKALEDLYKKLLEEE